MHGSGQDDRAIAFALIHLPTILLQRVSVDILTYRPASGPSLQPEGCLRSFLNLFRSTDQRLGGCNTKDKMATIVHSAQDQQHFEGWGTSLCWFGNIVGGFDDPIRHHLMDLLFDPKKGLGMEICRYNIGGSGWSNKDTGNFRYGADIARSVRSLSALCLAPRTCKLGCFCSTCCNIGTLPTTDLVTQFLGA